MRGREKASCSWSDGLVAPVKNIGSAFLAAQHAIKNPHLDATNPHFGNTFASLGAVIDAIKPAANANGLAITQEPCALDSGEPGLRTRVIFGETGEFYESTMPLFLAKKDSQAHGSAITYARRYALAAIFGVVGEPDDDGNAASSRGASDGAVTPRVTASVPAPAPAFSEPEAVRKAREAQAAKADREPPADGGDPGAVEIHFGKNQGRRLSDLSPKQIEWYATTWEPNPQYANDVDRRLKLAAQMLHGIGVPDDELSALEAEAASIPF